MRDTKDKDNKYVDFFDEEKFVAQTTDMDDETLIALSLELIAYYIKNSGYDKLATNIAIYGNGRPLVRCFDSLQSPHVIWSVDFLNTPYKVKRDYIFGA